MGNAFHLVPNEVETPQSPDKIFAFEEDNYDRSVKNGVIWAHRGGNVSVSSEVTIKQATEDKFTPVPMRERSHTAGSPFKRVSDTEIVVHKKRAATLHL